MYNKQPFKAVIIYQMLLKNVISGQNIFKKTGKYS